jgi:protein-disulfide isomerase-like protein with CxxC motif
LYAANPSGTTACRGGRAAPPVRPPPLESELPASSVPALTAAKCAEWQGAVLFERFHQRLFAAHFHDNLDISQQHVLWRLASDIGLDLARFQPDFTDGEAYQEVLHDYAEGVAWFGVSALPTVVFNEKVSLLFTSRESFCPTRVPFCCKIFSLLDRSYPFYA